MTDLPDVNVWLALADANHVHHAAARRYWQNEAASVVAFCRVSMLGFLRLSTHQGVLSRPLAPGEAWGIYQVYLDETGVSFVPEAPTIDDAFCALTCGPDFYQRLWTDAYLAAFALSAGCRIISFDSDFGRCADLDFLHLTPTG